MHHPSLCTLGLLGGLAVWNGGSPLLAAPPAEAQADLSLFRKYAGHQGAIRKARELMNQRRFPESRRLLQPCLEAIPDHAEAHHLLAQMAYEERRFEEALSHARLAEQSLIKLEQLRRAELAAADAQDAALETALKNSLINLEAAGVDPRGCSGSLYTTQQHILNDHRQKLGRLVDETDILGVPAELYLLEGNCLFRLKRLEEAKDRYQVAIQKNPSGPAAWNNLIGLCLGSGDLPQAREWLDRANKARIDVRAELRKALEDRPRP